jgi:cytochrome c551/c552
MLCRHYAKLRTLSAILMRPITTIIPFIIIGLLSFDRQNKTGKQLFEKHCSPCHGPNIALTGPPFQNIRNDYGLDWTLKWVKDNQALIKQKDPKAVYIYYAYNMALQPAFHNLSNADIIKILDYVDTFAIDSSQYSHRKLSDMEKQKIIEEEDDRLKRQSDDLHRIFEKDSIDTSNYKDAMWPKKRTTSRLQKNGT